MCRRRPLDVRPEDRILDGSPDWYRDAIVYQLHVRSYSDSSGDGVGDVRGLIGKLDYLHDLGVTAIWLLPFYPSPLRDDGYDISDYRSVNPAYGSLADLRELIRQAHRRGLRVITELVINHTSDQHPWFQRARRAPPGSRWRSFYVWSDTPDRYRGVRVIFQDFEAANWSWDPVARAYYWHRFYSHQPDLNFDSADVRRAVMRLLDYWLRLGVDGLRLDAVPYLYEREGTSCENLPETHAFLRALRQHVDERFPGRMLLAEANQWPEDAAEYFGSGDECHMAFHFPLMPRQFMAIQMEDRFPVVDILQQTPELPEGCQWALFLRNHDELTLEMVTDEERDYMYRVYAHDRQARINLGIRRRLAPLLGNDRTKIELMNGLLLSLPGTPVLYYGDEIGMGDNIYLGDRDGVRTPMQWSADRNAGFSRANPQALYLPPIIDPEFHYETVNVEAQLNNSQSLLWWMRRLLALRKRHPVFGRGRIELLHPENRRVLAFVRADEAERVLVVASLSRHAQYVELDLSPEKGSVPVEMLGQTAFPPIGELPYLLTLGPHAVYWFALRPATDEILVESEGELPVVAGAASLEALLDGPGRAGLEAALAEYLPRRRWFAGKARRIRGLRIADAVRVGPARSPAGHLAVLEVEFGEGEPESYAMPLRLAEGRAAERVQSEAPGAVVARVDRRGEPGVVHDALLDRDFCAQLLDAIVRRRRLRGRMGTALGRSRGTLRAEVGAAPPEPSVYRAEQSNTSVAYGTQLMLKLFRRQQPGTNPELELGAYLSERSGFAHVPRVEGSLTYRRADGFESTLALLTELVANEGDAWGYTLDALGRFYEWILTSDTLAGAAAPTLPAAGLVELARAGVPDDADEGIGAYLEAVILLGRRTAQMHAALAADSTDPALAPEPFTRLYQRAIYQSMRNLSGRNLRLLRRRIAGLAGPDRELAERVLEDEPLLMERFRRLADTRLEGLRTRTHGDYHLGQVLFTGRDLVIIDFEGEPARPISERRIKRSPLRDVAGMIRSFHYAAFAALAAQVEQGSLEAESEAHERLATWGRWWFTWVSAAYLGAYLEEASDAAYLPPDDDGIVVLLDAFLLEKAVYEIGYELNNRPEWIRIPLIGIIDLITRAE